MGIQPAVNRWRAQTKQVVFSLVAASLMLSGGAVQAGLLQPLLQMMRPKLESQLADQCQQLAKQALRDAELDLEPISGIEKQPCQALAKPISECLIRETSRSGRELGVISELLVWPHWRRRRSGDQALSGIAAGIPGNRPTGCPAWGALSATASVTNHQFTAAQLIGRNQRPSVRLRQRRWQANSIARNPAKPTSKQARAQGELELVHLIGFQ